MESIGAFIITAAPYISAGMSLLQGFAGFQSARYDKAQYEDEANTARLAAAQDEVQRRKNLASVLATQEAIRAGRGVDLYDGTGRAIRDASIAEAEADIETARLNYMAKINRYSLAADQAEAKGVGALAGGLMSAAGAIAKTKTA